MSESASSRVGEGMRLVPAERLRALTQQVFQAAGADEEAAASMARSLVLSNLRGVDSHGFMRVPEYLGQIRNGRIAPAARPSVAHEDAVRVHVDGHRCFGQVAATFATLRAVEKARESGLALATAIDIFHVGRLGEYVELAAARDCIGLACCNGGPPKGNVAPFGGRDRALSTNPIAYAIPAGERPAIVADFATSASAEGKIRLMLQAGKMLPEPWIIDAEGNPSIDPHDLYTGGAIRPMAGHKGFALGLLVEILGGVVAGAGCACLGDEPGNGFVILVLDVSSRSQAGATPPRSIGGLQAFKARIDQVIEAIEAVPPAPGFERVVVPGEPEVAAQAERERFGIPIAEETWQRFKEAALSVGIEVKES